MNSLLSITLLLKGHGAVTFRWTVLMLGGLGWVVWFRRRGFFSGLNSEMASEGAFRVVLRRALMVGAWGASHLAHSGSPEGPFLTRSTPFSLPPL